MQSFSEIDTTSKRASKAAGFAWGVAEEIGKNMRNLEMFGLPGVKNLNLYLKKIKKNPNCSALFYGKKEKIQLRLKTECEVNFNNEITKESWKKTGHVSRKCYLVTNGPGTVSEKPTSGLNGKFDNFDLRTSTLIPSLVRKVAEAETSVEIWGDGSAGRDIIHARDIAGAAIFAVENQITKPLNVGHGRTFTIKEVIETLVAVSGKDLAITHDLSKPTGDQFRVPNTERLNGYGFQPSVSLEEGLKETMEWYLANGPTTGRFNPFQVEENSND